MARRVALLMGSNVALEESMSGIDKTVRKNNVEIMRDALGSLGDTSFSWVDGKGPKITTNPRRRTVIELIDKAGNPDPDPEDVFLFYYFGHGLVGIGGGLCLGFQDARLDRDTKPFELAGVVNEVRTAGFRKMILVVDCCDSGRAARAITFPSTDFSHFLLASVDSGWSRFSSSGGHFTRALTDALRHPSIDTARDPQFNAVTAKSWFEYAQSDVHIEGQRAQAHGDLDDEIIVEVSLPVADAVNLSAPTKSAYTKLFNLLTLLGGTSRSLDTITNEIRTRQLPAFTLSRNVGGQVIVDFVSRSTIHGYLLQAKDLGFVDETPGGAWSCSTTGRNATRANGSTFNRALVDAVLLKLDAIDLSEKTLRSALFSLPKDGLLPSVDNLERWLISKGKPTLSKKDMRFALRLLAYSGFLQRASGDTFFPR